ncbi:unnamed protein product [Nesidiocoris tenuis]|uniref:Uncharacterized protein n=1 Tax=Nesidiocoris tenuis TaxID=355587 RepID=A0A6H5HHE2_9HEMI|nr:unnamed protein product [Nesidiocoris tenuis]
MKNNSPYQTLPVPRTDPQTRFSDPTDMFSLARLHLRSLLIIDGTLFPGVKESKNRSGQTACGTGRSDVRYVCYNLPQVERSWKLARRVIYRCRRRNIVVHPSFANISMTPVYRRSSIDLSRFRCIRDRISIFEVSIYRRSNIEVLIYRRSNIDESRFRYIRDQIPMYRGFNILEIKYRYIKVSIYRRSNIDISSFRYIEDQISIY